MGLQRDIVNLAGGKSAAAEGGQFDISRGVGKVVSGALNLQTAAKLVSSGRGSDLRGQIALQTSGGDGSERMRQLMS